MDRLGSVERLQRRGYSGKQKRWVEGDECENEDGRQAKGRSLAVEALRSSQDLERADRWQAGDTGLVWSEGMRRCP